MIAKRYPTTSMHRRFTLPLLIFAFTLGTLAFFTPSTYSSTPPTPGAFVTTWDTTLPGVTDNDQIRIPGTGSGYSYSIYWESLTDPGINGTTSTSTTNNITLTFPAPGQYRVDIIGAFPRILFNNGGDRQKILTVEQWGSNAWVSMERAFFGAANLRVPATDAPNLSGVTSMANMFQSASSFNDPIEHWDVSNVENIVNLFFGASSFNQPLQDWNVGRVTSMSRLFAQTQFNQPIGDWNVSSTTDMFDMFRHTPFNQDISGWDVSNVLSFRNMFIGATEFNQPLNSWNVSSATNMQAMFNRALAFNQPLDNWDTSKVTDMSRMFKDGTGDNNWEPAEMSFNQNLESWNTSRVIDFSEMFSGSDAFDQNLSTWNIASTTNMTNMFLNASL